MRTLLTILGLCCMMTLNAQKTSQNLAKGNENYRQNQFGKAKEEYTKVLQKDQLNAIANFNSGNASMKLKQYEEAAKSFEAAASATNDPYTKSQAFYNQGLAYIKQNKLVEAIQAFKKSLRLNPNDNDTRENLQKALKELKPQPQKPNDKQNDKNKKNPQSKDQQVKTKLTKEEAEKLLNKLQKEEKDLQKQVQKKNQSSRQLKDW